MKEIDDSKKDSVRLTTFYLPNSLHTKFKEICVRESVPMGTKLQGFIIQYLKKHGEGNPNYELTKWEDPDFKMTPAFGESMVQKWNPFIDKCSETDLKDMLNKSEAITRRIKQRYYEK